MRPALLAALLLAAPPVRAAEGRVTFVACAPGYPGTTAEAQPSMDAFAAAVARAAGLPPDALGAVYEPTEKDGLARLTRPDAAAALVPLPFLLKHRAALGLTPRLQVVTREGATETWSLVARKGRVTSPASLAGFTVVSIAGYAPAFVRGAVGAWGRIPESARVVESGQVLSALRKAASGADVAVLLDGAQSASFPTLPFGDELEVVARSAPLPTAFVVTVGRRLTAARWRPLEQALLALPSRPDGAAALEGIRMQRFVAIDPAALAGANEIEARSSR